MSNCKDFSWLLSVRNVHEPYKIMFFGKMRIFSELNSNQKLSKIFNFDKLIFLLKINSIMSNKYFLNNNIFIFNTFYNIFYYSDVYFLVVNSKSGYFLRDH